MPFPSPWAGRRELTFSLSSPSVPRIHSALVKVHWYGCKSGGVILDFWLDSRLTKCFQNYMKRFCFSHLFMYVKNPLHICIHTYICIPDPKGMLTINTAVFFKEGTLYAYIYTYVYSSSKSYELVTNTAVFFKEGILNWFDYNRADMYCAKRTSIGKIHLLAIINEFLHLLFFLCSMCQLHGNQINLKYL